MKPSNSTNPSILLTFDIEDWFQVENFKPYIPFSTWPSCELRVEQNTHKLLDLLDQNSSQQINGNGQRTTDNKPGNKPSLRQWRIGLSQSHPQTEKSQQSIKSGKSCLTMPKATFFVLGWIAERLPGLVREIHSRGHEVASHGYRHKLCNESSPRDLQKDLVESKKRLEDTIGAPVYGYRAPSFSISDNVLKIIEDCGYLYDSSYNSFGMNSRYGHLDISRNNTRGIAIPVHQKSAIENRQFFELPVSNLPLFPFPTSDPSAAGPERSRRAHFRHFCLPWGGGGYFRLIPFPLFKTGAKYILGQENGYVFYMHPWEVDPTQPRVNQASLFFKFRHYTNLSKTASKLSSFIEAFKSCDFMTCYQYLQLKMR